MLTIGLDSGSTTTKGVLYDGETTVAEVILLTGFNPRQRLEEVHQTLLKSEVLEGIETNGNRESIPVYTTGYGRDLFLGKTQSITEITCHGFGAKWLASETRTILDIGGQDTKVIGMDERGQITGFLMNDKCAAGTGRFIEMMMRILKCDLDELGALCNNMSASQVKISSMCAVFAESEVVSLLAQGIEPEVVAFAVVDAICERSAQFVSRLDNAGPYFFTGGLAQSALMRERLSYHLGSEIASHEKAQLAGAIGAAIIGHQKYYKKR